MNRFKAALGFLKQYYMQALAILIFFGTVVVLSKFATDMTNVGMPREIGAAIDAGEAHYDEEGIALPAVEEELFHE